MSEGPSPGALAPVTPAAVALSAPRRLTPQYAVALVAALALLVPATGAWLLWAVYAIASLVLDGVLLPALVIAATGLLLGSGWRALLQSVRARLRRPDLSEVEALPEGFDALSAQLQRLLRHTRTVRAALADPELETPAVLRDLFDWVTTISEVSGEDRELLADRGLAASVLRAEVVALHEAPDARAAALDLLARFERVLLERGGDPFRGGLVRRPR